MADAGFKSRLFTHILYVFFNFFSAANVSYLNIIQIPKSDDSNWRVELKSMDAKKSPRSPGIYGTKLKPLIALPPNHVHEGT